MISQYKKKTLVNAVAVAGLSAAVVFAGSASAGVTQSEIDSDATSTGDVLSWGMGQQGQRYSSLDKINKKNVKRLVPAWSFSFGGEKQRGQEAQPVIKDGRMYVTASYSRLYAIDSKTGEELWQYDHRLPDGILPCCDVVNRGAALYDDLVIFGTLDARIIALHKDTGKVVWRSKVDDYKAGYSITAAPLIVKDMVITGVAGGEFGVIGRVEARDAKSGKLRWTRPSVEGHMGYIWKDGKKVENGISGKTNATWPGDVWKTGGAAPWLGGTYDHETGLIFYGTGNPVPLERPYASRRQSLLQLDPGHQSGYRQDSLVLPVHAKRWLGLRRCK